MAAKKNNLRAMMLLAQSYHYGFGNAKDEQKAISYCSKAKKLSGRNDSCYNS